MKNPKFSILTSCYKRGIYLPNIHQSLKSQYFRDFEWLIGIDHSNDDSLYLARELKSTSDINITIISANIHIGKSYIDNRMIEASSGDWLLWCDSDDWITPNCLSTIVSSLNHASSSIQNRPRIILADLKSFYNLTARIDYPKTYLSTWSELIETKLFAADYMICIDSKLLAAKRFPEVDFYIAEGYLWLDFHSQQTLYIESDLMIRNYLTDGVTRTRRIRYPRAKMLNFSKLLSTKLHNNSSLFYKLVLLIQYLRFGMHIHSLLTALRSLPNSRTVFLLCPVAIPIALIYFFSDLFQSKIERTDLVFASNAARVSVTLY